MPFGEIVIGSPGSGKSTYCYGKHQLLSALARPISIVNLDPANDALPYPCAIDISDLITLKDVMQEYELGPNGGLIYCMEYLEKNFDWLEERLEELGDDAYVLFDLPGQVELSTNHESVKKVVERLQKVGFRLVAVHLCDAHYITDATKYISVLLLSLRAMLQLELPHINVLSKIDLLAKYGDLDFNLDFYTEVQDLTYLQNLLSSSLPPKFTALNMAMISLVEDFSLVGFETLAVEDKESMLHLMRAVDRASGYVFVPPPVAPAGSSSSETATTKVEEMHSDHNHNHNHDHENEDEDDDAKMQRIEKEEAERQRAAPAAVRPNAYALFSSAMGSLGGRGGDVRDVQERWIDSREAYDAFERREWRREGERARGVGAAQPGGGMGAAPGGETGGGKEGGDDGMDVDR